MKKKMHDLPFYGSYCVLFALVLVANWYFVTPVFIEGSLEIGTFQISWTRGREFFPWHYEIVFILISIAITTVISSIVYKFAKYWFADSRLFYIE
jgi:hypothetical protein